MNFEDLSKEQLITCCKLLIRAYKNKDRQFNYWGLYHGLEKNEITEEQFDKEIEENEDKYVWPAGKETTREELMLAVNLVDDLGGDAADVYDGLFELSTTSINKIIEELNGDESNQDNEGES